MNESLKQQDTIDSILQQLQYGTVMSDSQEPMLTNNREIAELQLQALANIQRLEDLSYLKELLKPYLNTTAGQAILEELDVLIKAIKES